LKYQLRKVIKNRGHFPNDDAAIKLLWLAIRDIEDKRARARAKEKGTPKGTRKAAGHLVEGVTVQGWKAALGALALAYPTESPNTSTDQENPNYLHRKLDKLSVQGREHVDLCLVAHRLVLRPSRWQCRLRSG